MTTMRSISEVIGGALCFLGTLVAWFVALVGISIVLGVILVGCYNLSMAVTP